MLATQDDISIFARDGVAELQVRLVAPEVVFRSLLSLGFLYADVLLIVDMKNCEFDEKQYWIAQKDSAILDLRWILNALSRLEAGWHIEQDVLVSSEASMLRSAQVKELLFAHRLADRDLVQTS